MTKTTLICIMHFAGAIVATAKRLAEARAEDNIDTSTPEAGAPAEQPTTTRRGRVPAKETPPAEPEKGKPATAGVPEADLRALIAPLVQEQGRGAEVKALIAKHGGTKLSDLPPASHAAFVRDIEGLLI